jgi:hypothetical protein
MGSLWANSGVGTNIDRYWAHIKQKEVAIFYAMVLMCSFPAKVRIDLLDLTKQHRC